MSFVCWIFFSFKFWIISVRRVIASIFVFIHSHAWEHTNADTGTKQTNTFASFHHIVSSAVSLFLFYSYFFFYQKVCFHSSQFTRKKSLLSRFRLVSAFELRLHPFWILHVPRAWCFSSVFFSLFAYINRMCLWVWIQSHSWANERVIEGERDRERYQANDVCFVCDVVSAVCFSLSLNFTRCLSMFVYIYFALICAVFLVCYSFFVSVLFVVHERIQIISSRRKQKWIMGERWQQQPTTSKIIRIK